MLIIPRVFLETIPMELLGKKKNWNKAIDLIVTECKLSSKGDVRGDQDYTGPVDG
ncbi:hypothetical protein Scep_021434 [Stephania cephalantha]|uniref:Uncharacterized protein n=1 Tax=Stephania cephalantha TaxID=152367 RepID=A0AAP0F3E6_9MAGN